MNGLKLITKNNKIMKQVDLKKIAEQCASKIEKAESEISYFETPFKHAVIDNFFSEEFAKDLLEMLFSLEQFVFQFPYPRFLSRCYLLLLFQ